MVVEFEIVAHELLSKEGSNVADYDTTVDMNNLSCSFRIELYFQNDCDVIEDNHKSAHPAAASYSLLDMTRC